MSGKHGKEETRRKKSEDIDIIFFHVIFFMQPQDKREPTEAEIVREAERQDSQPTRPRCIEQGI